MFIRTEKGPKMKILKPGVFIKVYHVLKYHIDISHCDFLYKNYHAKAKIPVLYVKFYWNTSISNCGGIIYDFFK